MSCKVCGHKTHVLFQKKVLNKHNVDYYECKNCGFVFTEKPYWLKEAYSNAIADADTGLLSRNLYLSKVAANIIYFYFDKHQNHLDYAGGYGVMTRLMRDIGFNYFWVDLKSKNIFAKYFGIKNKQKFQVVTAFEFFEHIEDPLKELKKIFDKYKCEAMLISTELYKKPINKKWWYLLNELGQHISFYRLDTLTQISANMGLYLYSDQANIHLFSKKPLSKIKFKLITKPWFIKLCWFSMKLKSKTFEDHIFIRYKK